MVTLQDKLNEIKVLDTYVDNSLYLKSADLNGAVFKYLITNNGVANRKEIFYAFDGNSFVNILDAVVTDSKEVDPPS